MDRVRFGALLMTLAISCAGKSASPESSEHDSGQSADSSSGGGQDEASSGSGGSGRAGSGGYSQADASSGSGGSGGAATDARDRSCSGDADSDDCILSCEEEVNYSGSLECLDGEWRCPAGQERRSTCPAGSCAVAFWYCCDRVNGFQSRADCVSGRRADCGSGTDRIYGEMCAPNGISVSRCEELQGRLCTTVGHECHLGPVTCTCKPEPRGPAWMCRTLLP